MMILVHMPALNGMRGYPYLLGLQCIQPDDVSRPSVLISSSAYPAQTFLSYPWNLFDAAMVSIGYTQFLPTSGSGADSFRALRAIRALRPLRTITRFDSLRSVVVCFMEAIPLLASVASMLMFFLFLFGVCGVQLFGGVYHKACIDVRAPPRCTYACFCSAPMPLTSAALLLRCALMSEAGALRCRSTRGTRRWEMPSRTPLAAVRGSAQQTQSTTTPARRSAPGPRSFPAADVPFRLLPLSLFRPAFPPFSSQCQLSIA